MGPHDTKRTRLHGVLDLLMENRLEGMVEAMATMLNKARRSNARALVRTARLRQRL